MPPPRLGSGRRTQPGPAHEPGGDQPDRQPSAGMIGALLLPCLLLQAPQDSLSLEAALALAESHRGQPRAAAAAVAAARAGVRLAGSVPNPVGGYSYTEDLPRQHASLDQSLDWLLTRGPERSAARSGVLRAEADSTQGAADLAAEVRTAFYGVVAARELAGVTTEQRVLADSLATLAGERLARGDIAEQERDQLVLEATRALQRESSAREAAGVAWARLARSIGWEPALSPAALRGALDDGLAEGAPAVTTGGDLSLLPRLAAVVADSVAAAERVRRAVRAQLPLPSVQLGADWDDPGNPDRFLAVLGLSLPLPLWHHGSAASAVAKAEALQVGAVLSEARLETVRVLADAGTRLRERQGRAVIARDSLLPVARRIRARATVAYRLGETGLVPLLEALRAEREVTAEAVDDLLAYQEARAAWHQALGRAR
jgi:cobalt-zinc-cadmium efflux system outer membrane protein